MPSKLIRSGAGVSPACPIRNARIQVWRGGSTEIIEQQFDGRYGYLYGYEIRCDQALEIAVRVSGIDLHGLYVFQSKGALKVKQANQPFRLSLSSKRACFLYAAMGSYLVRIPQGRTIVFGFMLDAGLFKRQKRPFPHLIPLLTAMEATTPAALASRDFKIDPLAEQHIRSLCERLNPRDLSHESLIMQELITLVKLSREAIYTETEKTDPRKQHVDQARKWIDHSICNLPHSITMQDVAGRLNLNPDYLNRLHKFYYHCTLSAYKNACLLRYIKELLRSGHSINETAFKCGFDGPSSFGKFFRRHMGTSAQVYVDRLKSD